ncbi:MAG: bifunctional glutamate N-acetyltransferase/amino-acid acetyltransferase ArgJ, partial [Actinomycetia bacterium]|nr:bifunctional glutamate N-acetyltransferase/amino-acid acetyltransferase ArgJ [Actinomycetes bacterium]
MSVSPLAPAAFPPMSPIDGVRLATYEAGLRYQERADLMMAELAPGTTVAGVFTSSLCPSAPVDWCRSILDRGTARAIVCNAGNANAFTGTAGATAASLTAEVIAGALGCQPVDVFLASTGVIGETLDQAALADALPALVGAEATGWEQAAGAIRTTDTFSKGACRRVDGPVQGVVAGIAKGSGMIAPDMATMLGFVFTDLAVEAHALQAALSPSVEGSYNRITVDSDTSTSDTVLLFATGAAGNEPIEGPGSAGWDGFVTALDEVNLELAHQIVRDGEGATKFVEIRVTGAEHDPAAKAIALAIANSPLVKTALAAEDANWGRIVMAVGKAGQRADRDRLAIWIGPEPVTADGVVVDGYSEDRATEHLRNDDVTITVDVGIGDGQASVWTCDLTHGYIEI